jgi:hypothetical protein
VNYLQCCASLVCREGVKRRCGTGLVRRASERGALTFTLTCAITPTFPNPRLSSGKCDQVRVSGIVHFFSLSLS